MKKLLSVLLCLLLLNLTYPLYGLAIEENSNENSIEHIQLSKELAKKAPTNIIIKTEAGYEIQPYNILQAVHAQKFEAKTAKEGDEIVFLLKDGLSTVEGSKLLPESTKLVAQITKIEKPKSFNRCEKLYVDFKYIELPDGTQKPIQAKIFNKKEYLSRGKLNALGKGFSTTFGTAAAGTAAGCGIGIATGAVIVGGLAIGLPIGLGVGGIAGLVTPGLRYKANAGDKVNIQLLSTLIIENTQNKIYE